jgi:hypothetical protein
MPQDQEVFYDERIAPLMEQIAEIAKQHNIPFVAVFQRNEDSMYTYSHLPDGTISELYEAGYAIGVYQYR